jgi:hypothetical protein
MFIALLAGCGKHEPEEQDLGERLGQLQNKAAFYLSQSGYVQDQYGFIYSDQCDSVLFSALYAISGANVNLKAAQEKPGKWQRRPISSPCYPKDSGSEISRDMFVGFHEQRLQFGDGLTFLLEPLDDGQLINAFSQAGDEYFRRHNCSFPPMTGNQLSITNFH